MGLDLLIKAGLYGAGLIEISTSVLVARYNRCLERLGIEPTKLTRFRIDGAGWSPEVAKEKGSNLYLSHGVPNQMVVILTPDQRRRPIYFKFNSFERRMIDTFFSRFEEQIADITSTNGIALAIDQGLTEVSSPQDLLLIDHVTLRASTDGSLTEQAQNQRQLVERFMNEKEAWFDPTLRASIIESAREVGDLRSRQVEIPEMQFDDLRSFYSVALGGVFVIRTEPGLDDLLIVQEKEALGTSKKVPKNMLWVFDPKLVDRLLESGLLDINFSWFRDNPKELDYKMECLAVDALASPDDGLDFGKLTAGQRKKMLLGIRNKMPSTYFELERLRRVLEKGTLPDREDLSREMVLTLMHPSGNLKSWYREVIWRIICRLTQYDPLRLYVADRSRFFTTYESWPVSKQVWATDIITRLYKPHRGIVPKE
ncbi:MAG: hypothetical protein KW788_04195 [Candidatus Doudnabacteria bacterium]|nr:hypothetical protein [Candidatus Doudnabacteria bacterium]